MNVRKKAIELIADEMFVSVDTFTPSARRALKRSPECARYVGRLEELESEHDEPLRMDRFVKTVRLLVAIKMLCRDIAECGPDGMPRDYFARHYPYGVRKSAIAPLDGFAKYTVDKGHVVLTDKGRRAIRSWEEQQGSQAWSEHGQRVVTESDA